jgi:hypothetical protein
MRVGALFYDVFGAASRRTRNQGRRHISRGAISELWIIPARNRVASGFGLKTLRAGDTLIVWKVDRLGRSLRDLITMLDALRGSGIRFQSLTEAIDTQTTTGRAMWQMIGVLAEDLVPGYTVPSASKTILWRYNWDVNRDRITRHGFS